MYQRDRSSSDENGAYVRRSPVKSHHPSRRSSLPNPSSTAAQRIGSVALDDMVLPPVVGKSIGIITNETWYSRGSGSSLSSLDSPPSSLAGHAWNHPSTLPMFTESRKIWAAIVQKVVKLRGHGHATGEYRLCIFDMPADVLSQVQNQNLRYIHQLSAESHPTMSTTAVISRRGMELDLLHNRANPLPFLLKCLERGP